MTTTVIPAFNLKFTFAKSALMKLYYPVEPHLLNSFGMFYFTLSSSLCKCIEPSICSYQ